MEAVSQPVKRDTAEVSNRIWTIPNVLSFLRLLGVPVFFILIIQHRDIAAVVLLYAVASLTTDWVDGRIARQFNQITKLGQVLDPAADRLYIFATVLGLAIREIIPWWLLVLLVGRDHAGPARPCPRSGPAATSLPVNFIGKAATFCLLYALPLVLLGAGPWVISPASRVIGWAFAIWGVYLYWWAGIMYYKQSRELVSGIAERRTD